MLFHLILSGKNQLELHCGALDTSSSLLSPWQLIRRNLEIHNTSIAFALKPHKTQAAITEPV